MRTGVGMPGAREGATASAHRRRPGPLRFLVAVLLGLAAVWGLGSPAVADDGSGLVKVFVVQDPAQTGGAAPTLQSVAQSTLGDPSKADEIFQLNKGLAQPDGSALNTENDPLHPGWILRLPQDASGPEVQLAQDNSAQAGQNPSAQPGTAVGQAATGSQQTQPKYLTLPLSAALGALGAVLAAIVTAVILLRRQIGRGIGALGHALSRLREPARRRRRLQARRSVGGRFASDMESVQRAYGTLGEFGAARETADTPVHAMRVDGNGVTLWVAPAETVPEPWLKVDETRWRRVARASGVSAGGRYERGVAPVDRDACLVRVGTDDDGEQVFIDLSRLDGILTVTGDHTVARDVVRQVLLELSRTRPGTPVTVLRGTDNSAPIEVPADLQELARVDEGFTGRRETREGAIRGAAARRPLKGVVVMSGTPTQREIAELDALCGVGGAGWTGLVCGDVDGAHWRWHTDAAGGVEIPVLGTRLTVPA
jgi:hypothetical protein